jgi:hypothetical protein
MRRPRLAAQFALRSGLFPSSRSGIRARTDDVLRLPTTRHHRPVACQPRLHFGDLSLLLDDNGFGKLSRPRVFGMSQGNTSHVDRTLMMRDHVQPEIYIRVASEWDVHIAHHPRMSGFILADGWRIGAGAAVRPMTFVSTMVGSMIFLIMTMVGPMTFVFMIMRLRGGYPPSAHHEAEGQ